MGACCPPPAPSAIKPAHGSVGYAGEHQSGALARPWHERWPGVNRLRRFNITRGCAKYGQSPTGLAWCPHRYGFAFAPFGFAQPALCLAPQSSYRYVRFAHVAQLPGQRTRAGAPVRSSSQALRAGWSWFPPPARRVTAHGAPAASRLALPVLVPRHPSAPSGSPKANGPEGPLGLAALPLQFTEAIKFAPALNLPPVLPVFEARKRGTLAARIRTLAPVRGLRPLRADRLPT